ncbi:hypothetical protein [Scleromatobacter humisilvae]|uniref:Uncharacterized protein n=1 Tax=Scleromatobacter humisilvae TaxID=2897159 RepID=A0A9X1YGZ8_9BURK|nr:hypothetical protein [Scleromatobacter humisilvae]MCK9685557.1 hypothetical protein [Scleromatobacter humisilvae]
MSLITRLATTLFAAGLCVGARADDRLACAPDTYLELKSLASLPVEVRFALEHAPREGGEISDRGGPFNMGDVGGGPFRRFVLAAMGTSQLIVSLEHGGYGYQVEAWTFTYGPTGWVGLKTQPFIAMPKSARELVGLVCK